MLAQDVVKLLRENGSGGTLAHLDESSAQVHRTSLLPPVLAAFAEACAHRSGQAVEIAQALGDGSRDEVWRIPLGNSGILDFCLDILSNRNSSIALTLHALRLVGNSCADEDKNRARVVHNKRLQFLVQHVANDELMNVAVPALFNIVCDYEPARKTALELGLNDRLLGMLSQVVSLDSDFCHLVLTLLTSVVTAEVETLNSPDRIPHPATILTFLNTAAKLSDLGDLRNFLLAVSLALNSLSSPLSQKTFISSGRMGPMWRVTYLTCTKYDAVAGPDDDLVPQLHDVRRNLLTILSDLTAHREITDYYPLATELVPLFQSWLATTNTNLQAAACLCLGNLSRSDDPVHLLVANETIRSSLNQILSDTSMDDPVLLHAALSLCKNLAVPHANRPIFLHFLSFNFIPRILSTSGAPQVQLAALRLMRLELLQAVKPEHDGTIPPPLPNPIIQALLLVFEASPPPVKTEAARCIVLVCRWLHNDASHWLRHSRRELLYAKDKAPLDLSTAIFIDDGVSAKVTRALSLLVTQSIWPTLHSEAWFSFALLSRSQAGALLVVTVLQDPAAQKPLAQVLTGKLADSHYGGEQQQPGSGNHETSQAASMIPFDRENALVLCTELLRRDDIEIPSTLASLLRELIKEGLDHEYVGVSRG